MSMISVENLSFTYEGSYDPVFEGVSFQLDTDWKLGFTGRNGRGKTTLLRLLQGRYEYGGKITASVEFTYFPYEVADTGRDALEVAESLDPKLQLWQLVRELSLLSLEEEILYRPFSSLSNGEQTKVLLALLFLRENAFLLIDEPTNHLDMEARAQVSRYLNRKKGYILVSHDRSFLDGCIDHVLSINRGDIEVQQGNFSTWQKNREYQDQYELAENQRLKREIRQLEEGARRAAQWSEAVEKTKFGQRNSGIKPDKGYIGHRAAKMMKRSKTAERRREEKLQEKAGLLKNLEQVRELKIVPLKHYAQKLAEAENLTLYYGEKRASGPVSFSINHGDRIALSGRNGCGKSSLLKWIITQNGKAPEGFFPPQLPPPGTEGTKAGMGDPLPDRENTPATGKAAPSLGQTLRGEGTLRLASGLILSWLPQDASFLTGDLRDFAQAREIDESVLKSILRKLDFSRVQFEKDMALYSGGQKKKVLLAASLCREAHLYLWDEPLNYIDVLSRIQIEELILTYEPTMIFVEHDRAFVDRVATGLVKL